jgi:hypothetical protein
MAPDISVAVKESPQTPRHTRHLHCTRSACLPPAPPCIPQQPPAPSQCSAPGNVSPHTVKKQNHQAGTPSTQHLELCHGACRCLPVYDARGAPPRVSTLAPEHTHPTSSSRALAACHRAPVCHITHTHGALPCHHTSEEGCMGLSLHGPSLEVYKQVLHPTQPGRHMPTAPPLGSTC